MPKDQPPKSPSPQRALPKTRRPGDGTEHLTAGPSGPLPENPREGSFFVRPTQTRRNRPPQCGRTSRLHGRAFLQGVDKSPRSLIFLAENSSSSGISRGCVPVACPKVVPRRARTLSHRSPGQGAYPDAANLSGVQGPNWLPSRMRAPAGSSGPAPGSHAGPLNTKALAGKPKTPNKHRPLAPSGPGGQETWVDAHASSNRGTLTPKDTKS